jgi:Family of unknown function (DUF6338)
MDVLDTFLITVLAGLPGALFTFAYERQTRIVRAAVSDRIMRLTAASAVFYVAAAPLGYWLYLRYGRTSRLLDGPLPWALWLVPIGLVICPVVLGLTLGSATRRGRPWARLWSGRSPDPRAWDAAFGHGPTPGSASGSRIPPQGRTAGCSARSVLVPAGHPRWPRVTGPARSVPGRNRGG